MAFNRQVLGILGVLALAASLVARPAIAQDWSVTPPPEGEVQDDFDAALSPYGEWMDVNGTRAWRPSASVVGEDFQPYATAGQWVYSDYGWYFQSDYPWGWAPFHYGRWALDPNFGWVWIPGQTWAPAWVDWRIGGGYIGWAPLPPIGWSVVVQPWRPYWCFVPGAYFPGNYWAYRLPVERIHYAYAATAPVHQAVAYGGARWYAGPPVAQVERLSSAPVPRVGGTLTPPAPGRVQAVHLQAPRSYPGGMAAPRPVSAGGSSAVGPRPASVSPASRQYQTPASVPRTTDPGRSGGASPATPTPTTPHPVPHGSSVRPQSAPVVQRPGAQSSGGASAGNFGSTRSSSGWGGASASNFGGTRSPSGWGGASASSFGGARSPSGWGGHTGSPGGSHAASSGGGHGGNAGRR